MILYMYIKYRRLPMLAGGSWEWTMHRRWKQKTMCGPLLTNASMCFLKGSLARDFHESVSPGPSIGWPFQIFRAFSKIYVFANECSPVSTTPAKNLSPTSPRICEKIQNGPDGILRDPVVTDSEKNLMLKISSQTPFTVTRSFFWYLYNFTCTIRWNQLWFF